MRKSYKEYSLTYGESTRPRYPGERDAIIRKAINTLMKSTDPNIYAEVVNIPLKNVRLVAKRMGVKISGQTIDTNKARFWAYGRNTEPIKENKS